MKDRGEIFWRKRALYKKKFREKTLNLRIYEKFLKDFINGYAFTFREVSCNVIFSRVALEITRIDLKFQS